VEGCETAQDSFADASGPDGADNFVLYIPVTLGDFGNIPSSFSNHVMSWDEVFHQDKHGHDNVLRDRYNVAAGNFSHSYTTIRLISSIQVNMIGTNACSDGEPDILGS
jgi:hypothetical protein